MDFYDGSDFVLAISLNLAGRDLRFPPEAFFDLASFRPLDITEKNDRYFLKFEGSDAGESYEGFFEMKDFRVVRREIRPGEFPENEPEVKTHGS